MLKTSLTIVAAAAIAVQTLSLPSYAMTDAEKAALAAAALIGVAALSHHKHHHRDPAQMNDADYTAVFERGYRDGLYNEPYDSERSSAAYGNGYDAGQKERSNRLAHKNPANTRGSVPGAAMKSCVTEVADSLGVGAHDVHLIRTGQEGADNFYIEFAVGHKHIVCGTNAAGQVFNLRDGRVGG
jgi:hypothetical protein